MNQRTLTSSHIQSFRRYLLREEKSAATVEKYLRDVRAFAAYAARAPITKELVLAYKAHLLESGYAIRSINSMLASLHSFFRFASWSDCRVKVLRQQQQTYCPEEKELTRAEYLRLLHAAGQDSQLRLVMQTICATGIRVSELRSFTAEAVRQNAVTVRCKGKTRTILLPEKLRRLLLDYVKKHRITSGPIFLNSCGAPLDRRTIWARMKALCRDADVPESKVFPHNLRKLFARIFYNMEKDIAKLADVLGHSSIDTTRIYIMTTGTEHRRQIERLGLVI